MTEVDSDDGAATVHKKITMGKSEAFVMRNDGMLAPDYA